MHAWTSPVPTDAVSTSRATCSAELEAVADQRSATYASQFLPPPYVRR